MLTGDNGILTQAQNSKTTTERSEIIEKAKLDVIEIQAGNEGKITETQLDEILAKYGTVSGEGEDKVITTTNGHTIKASEIYNGTLKSGGDDTPPTFAPETLTIGTAINTEKYGYKVTDYTEKTDVTGGWRLFYQDSNYTYIISDNCVGSYMPSDYYTNYANDTAISTVGKKLNPMISSLFTGSNTNLNIKATAWLTDTSDTGMWAEYKNDDAVFAIGSPTAELYVESFNATADTNGASKITLEEGKYGYIENTKSNHLQTGYNKGIYNKSTSSSWWLASPGNSSTYGGLFVNGNGYFNFHDVNNYSYAIRPVVCIQTSVFNSNYELVNQ